MGEEIHFSVLNPQPQRGKGIGDVEKIVKA